METKGGSIKSTSINGVKLSSICGQRNPAAWLAPKKLKALRKDKDHQRRVDIIQDLRFETATTKVKVTPDGEYVIASGIYPPQMKVFELRELSLKFERHLVSEIISFQDFEVDEESTEYLSLHPQSAKKQSSLLEEHFEAVMEDEEQTFDDSHASASQSSEEELDKVVKKQKALKLPRLYEVKDGRHAEAFWNSVSLTEEDVFPLGKRVALQEQQQASGGPATDVKLGPGGSREISFFSRSSKKYKAEEPREEKKRGVQSLGLKPNKSAFYSSRGGWGGRGRGGHGRGRGRGRERR